MTNSFYEKAEELKKKFSLLTTEERYQMLIQMGQQLSPFPEEYRTPNRIVPGCQSTLYLLSTLSDGRLYFKAQADALISAGLAAILIAAYSGESPETILTCPPDFIIELGLTTSLSLNRSNGLANIHLRMKQEALKNLVKF